MLVNKSSRKSKEIPAKLSSNNENKESSCWNSEKMKNTCSRIMERIQD